MSLLRYTCFSVHYIVSYMHPSHLWPSPWRHPYLLLHSVQELHPYSSELPPLIFEQTYSGVWPPLYLHNHLQPFQHQSLPPSRLPLLPLLPPLSPPGMHSYPYLPSLRVRQLLLPLPLSDYMLSMYHQAGLSPG